MHIKQGIHGHRDTWVASGIVRVHSVLTKELGKAKEAIHYPTLVCNHFSHSPAPYSPPPHLLHTSSACNTGHCYVLWHSKLSNEQNYSTTHTSHIHYMHSSSRSLLYISHNRCMCFLTLFPNCAAMLRTMPVYCGNGALVPRDSSKHLAWQLWHITWQGQRYHMIQVEVSHDAGGGITWCRWRYHMITRNYPGLPGTVRGRRNGPRRSDKSTNSIL